MSKHGWLRDIILVNECAGDNPLEPQAVDLFRSAGAACDYLEHWWVEEGHGIALTASGERVLLGVEERRIVVESYEPLPGGPEIVLAWLRYSATHLLEARRYKADRKKLQLGEAEARGELPTTLEGLIAYVGFVE